ncbi:thioredoxin family protein [uncultured Kordia sp.]|uniref:thioredoxin family protein n=1 Tax=uncultured Kordia sp. TaxID=507699 RepID=UPI0026388738|nr:thioredoxin family protein [uncultured Kordia sp.]
MKKICYIVLVLAFFACKDEKKTTPTEKKEVTISKEIIDEEEKELPILTGVQTRTTVAAAPYDVWFSPNYSTYPVDKETGEKVLPLLADVNIKVFMGTWCEDSQREVPHFYRILDVLKINEKKVELITVDEDKMTPEHLEDGFDITNVPTFIFYKDGKEINRIVESPVTSLEKDMLSILSGEDYKHTYAE